MYLLLLFYPPTDCLKTGATLGNDTGRELGKILDIDEVSVIEQFPYVHKEASGRFYKNRP